MKSKTNIRVNGRQSETEFDKPNTLHHLFEDCLQDIYDAEQQLVDTLPEMAEAVESEELREAFLNHLEETKEEVDRIETIFSRLNIDKGNRTCEAMQGLIEEARDIINEFEEGPVRDSALIIAAQKIEHYEIATYGSLCELADVLGLEKTKKLLGKTLEEEKDTDELLTDVSKDVNDEALERSETEESY